MLLIGSFALCGAKTIPADVGISQKIGSQLPLDALFRDDADGRERPLGDFFRTGRPAILVMGYYRCPQLCSVVMNGLVESLTKMRPAVGRDFDVFFVSIDPNETADLGAEKKRAYVRLYGKFESRGDWHFLTGPEASIRGLSQATGFRFQYDEKLRQFAHGSGLLILTPTGKISRYFYGIEFPPQEMADALKLAANEREGDRVSELLLLCYHYNPISGPYGMIIWRVLQAGAVLTLGSLVAFIVRHLMKEKRALAKKEVAL
jgi:protein SCO1/2